MIWKTIGHWQPLTGEHVLVYVSPDVKTAWYCNETGLWPHDYSHSEEGEPCNVGLPTHWMPLPNKPEVTRE